jgi:ubiquinone/menaquinone biosynthesis C-methylase UbiE
MSGLVDPRMRAYYDRRAPEYDDWWLGTGRFADRGRPGWDAEVAELLATLAELPPARTLDVACGTGFLTRHLPGELTAVDQSARMVAIAAERLPAARVLRADAAALPFADGAFDRLVAGHFYGHLREAERATFLAEAERVTEELVIVDSALRDEVEPEEWQERILDDGSQHTVYKRYFTGDGLAAELGGRGRILFAGRWFVAVSRRGA